MLRDFLQGGCLKFEIKMFKIILTIILVKVESPPRNTNVKQAFISPYSLLCDVNRGNLWSTSV